MKIFPAENSRTFKTVKLDCDLAIAGGGFAATCCAITAARAGAKVVLVQDRPVLGGNSSSEVRLWVLGATAHMTNNNRWAREGGLHDEILVENLYRNPEGNPLIFDTVLLEKVMLEPNITLLLNTAVIEASKSAPDMISGMTAFCSQNSTMYEIKAPLFADASGDGVLGFLSGAAFRMGAEARDEFGEKFAPDAAYGELLGHSIYFYSKDVGKPVSFTPPSYALSDITKIPRYKEFNSKEFGCRLWWIEYGGRLDTVHETEKIKWELWKVVYGVWNHIKNSGQFPDAANLTLEWVGQIPGKRESRRFEGPHIMTQQDIIEQRQHADAVAFGGWSIDLHPSDGVYSAQEGCNQWHSRGLYQIPYRSLYSRNIRNLFLVGRVLSASHVAFGSTRVMGTLANAGQAVGLAAALSARSKTALLPADFSEPERMAGLQTELMRRGQHIPGFTLKDPLDLAASSRLTASSRLQLPGMPPDGPLLNLEFPWAQMLPVPAGKSPKVTFTVEAAEPTELVLELRSGDKPDNHTPDHILASSKTSLKKGVNQVVADFKVDVLEPRYLFYVIKANPLVSVRCSQFRATGILTVVNHWQQAPGEDIGVQSFEFWTPVKRPLGHNFAMTIEPALDLFGAENLRLGLARPTSGPNAWIAAASDAKPSLQLHWDAAQTIAQVDLSFDPDYDHPMESVLMGQSERAIPFCVKHFRLLDSDGKVLAEQKDNHQARVSLKIAGTVKTKALKLELLESNGPVPRALFEFRCYAAPY